MGSKKDIGNIYKERLEGYTTTPHNRVWESIEAELKKTNRKTVPIWRTLTGIGILILLFSSIIIYNFNSNEDSNNVETNPLSSDSNSTKINTNRDNSNKNKLDNDNPENTNITNITDEGDPSVNTENSSLNTNKPQINTIQNTSKILRLSDNDRNTISSNNQTSKNIQNHIANNESEKNGSKANAQNQLDLNNNFSSATQSSKTKNKLADSATVEKYPIIFFDNEGLTVLEGEKLEKQQDKVQKPRSKPILISAYITPIYFNAFGKGSTIDKLLDTNKKVGGFNVNYGISATINISKKSSIRLGLAASDLSYTIKGADTTSLDQSDLFFINALNYDDLEINSESYNMLQELFGTNTVLDFEQQFKYLEIPIDYIYHLKDDSKLKVNLIGGFSILSLSDQTIIAKDSNGNSIKLGKALNLKDINFSFNFGGSLSYSLSKKFGIYLEPTFKYYLGTFTNDVDFKPYSIGLRFGIGYKF